jgi:hypothetical protein
MFLRRSKPWQKNTIETNRSILASRHSTLGSQPSIQSHLPPMSHLVYFNSMEENGPKKKISQENEICCRKNPPVRTTSTPFQGPSHAFSISWCPIPTPQTIAFPFAPSHLGEKFQSFVNDNNFTPKSPVFPGNKYKAAFLRVFQNVKIHPRQNQTCISQTPENTAPNYLHPHRSAQQFLNSATTIRP